MTENSITESDRGDDLETAVENAETVVESAESTVERVEDRIDAQDIDEPSDSEESTGQGSSFASMALKLLILILVVFGLAVWLLPRFAGDLPAGIAKHIMPGQQVLDERLAVMESKLDERAGATSATVEKMQAEIAALTERLAASEKDAAAARAEAESAKAEAAASAEAATSASTADSVISDAKNAASAAAEAADVATTAATEAGKVAAAASRDTASLARQMTSFEARMAQMSDELGALGSNLANTASSDGGSSPELAAAFAALKTRVDALGEQVNAPTDFLTPEDANGFATQDDLRSARTALAAEMRGQFDRLPDAAEIVTTKDLDSFRTAVDGKISDLTSRVQTAEKGASEAAQSAAAAANASNSAVGEVKVAIQGASLRSAVAALTSQMVNGASFKGALDEIEELTGKAAPEELASASDGVLTLGQLQRSFGRAAQHAISADIQANAEGDGALGKAGAKISSLFAGRSTTEREGSGTADVLSRVEARLREGALNEALSETGELSDAAKAGLGAWLTSLEARVKAESAASDFVATLIKSEG